MPQMPRILLPLMLAAAMLVPAGPATALPFHSATVSADGAPGDTAQGQDVVQVFTQGPETEAAARSSTVLRGHANAASPETNVLTGAQAQAGGQARGIYDDIIISGPAAGVESTLHLQFRGVFIDRRQVWSGDFDFHSNVTANVLFRASLNTIPGGSGQVEIQFDAFAATHEPNATVVFNNVFGDPPIMSASAAYTIVFSDFVQPLTCGNNCPFAGLEGLEAVGFSGTIDLPGIFPTNTPLVLDLDMSFLVLASSFFLASSGGQIDIEHTFGVPQNGDPVFDLPPGFTANSVSLGIVGNRVPGTPSSGVPAPASLMLVILGCAVAIGMWSRKAVVAR